MIITIHIILALTSLGCASYTALSPSRVKLRVTYLFTLGTIISGLILVFIHPATLAPACLSGIVYLGFIATTITLARKQSTSL